MGMKTRRNKKTAETPFIYAREQFGVWIVFVDGVPMKGNGFGGLAEFMSEASALAAAHTTIEAK